MNPDLDRIATEYWDFVLSTSPTDALLLGDHRFDEYDLEEWDSDGKPTAEDLLTRGGYGDPGPMG